MSATTHNTADSPPRRRLGKVFFFFGNFAFPPLALGTRFAFLLLTPWYGNLILATGAKTTKVGQLGLS